MGEEGLQQAPLCGGCQMGASRALPAAAATQGEVLMAVGGYELGEPQPGETGPGAQAANTLPFLSPPPLLSPSSFQPTLCFSSGMKNVPPAITDDRQRDLFVFNLQNSQMTTIQNPAAK